MPRYKLTIEYDGTGFAGWQRQADMPSIQQSIEEAIGKYCGEQVTLQCAGRTDAGVHAMGQVAHMDIRAQRSEYSIQQGINYHLETPQISILSVDKTSDDFHARFDAVKRKYMYHIITRNAPLAINNNRAWRITEPLDISAMQQAADEVLVGKHDFSSFRDSKCQAKSPIKTIDNISIIKQGQLITITIEALSFLHHQVRIIVGCLRLIGNGKWQISDLKAARDAKDRKAAAATAPACGLYLLSVDYPT